MVPQTFSLCWSLEKGVVERWQSWSKGGHRTVAPLLFGSAKKEGSPHFSRHQKRCAEVARLEHSFR